MCVGIHIHIPGVRPALVRPCTPCGLPLLPPPSPPGGGGVKYGRSYVSVIFTDYWGVIGHSLMWATVYVHVVLTLRAPVWEVQPHTYYPPPPGGSEAGPGGAWFTVLVVHLVSWYISYDNIHEINTW